MHKIETIASSEGCNNTLCLEVSGDVDFILS